MSRRLAIFLSLSVLVCAWARPASAGSDIVLRASNVTVTHGNWFVANDSSAAGGQYVGSTDYGWGTTDAPIAQPNDYFEVSFDAPANTPYHVWFRLRASGDSKYNDSVWVQYSDAMSGGNHVYAIGSASALDVNLERCSGCSEAGWGWQDGAYWLSQANVVQFATTGSHTLRVQIREDGVQIDQIVLSPSTWLSSSPGAQTNDTTIVPQATTTTTTSATTTTTTTSSSSVAGPYLGSPVKLPGRVEAENFDNGPDGVSYHDTTSGNSGGAYRQTNADIEGCSEGGYDVGWIEPGEWMNYAVNVASGGTYTVSLRVASPSGGGSLHLGFNGPSSVWTTVPIPATGGWQHWTTVSVPVTLGAGNQLMTLSFDTAGFNLNYIDVVAGTVATPAPVATSTGGSGVSVVTWNIHVDSSDSHARGAIDRLMALTPRPQVVVIQEAEQYLYNSYISELESKSGQTWQGVFRTHCPPGAWNGSTCTGSEDEGVGVFTSLPITGSSTTWLPGSSDQWHSARALVRVAVNVNGTTLQVFGTHLPVVASSRYAAMSDIKSYTSNYSKPQIVAGDFNAVSYEVCASSGMSPNFIDAWSQKGSGAGLTAFSSSPTMRIDYWFTDAGGRAHTQWIVNVPAEGTYSDHYPVMAYFNVQ